MDTALEDRWVWLPEYDAKARALVEQHFAGPNGLSKLFPCMRDSFPWADNRPLIADARVAAKNNTEYKGLERHASQYQAAAFYDYASHHWFLAAWWRRVDMITHDFDDPGHRQAIRFCLQMSAYNEALWRWQSDTARGAPPGAGAFDLDQVKVDALEAKSQRDLAAVTSW